MTKNGSSLEFKKNFRALPIRHDHSRCHSNARIIQKVGLWLSRLPPSLRRPYVVFASSLQLERRVKILIIYWEFPLFVTALC